LKIMKRSDICPDAHVKLLGQELDVMHKIDKFKHITTMGEMTAEHICHVLDMPDLKH